MATRGNEALDASAVRLLEARAEFDARLHGGGKRFPVLEFDRLWLAICDYAAQMTHRNWLHRDVAREFSGFREYLQLEIFDTPGEALRTAERMESILFGDHDPYPEDEEPPVPESMIEETDDDYGCIEGECAGCGNLGRNNEMGLCDDCSGKLERDLIRERDWAYSVTVYGMNNSQRNEVRNQILRKYGKRHELIVPNGPAKPRRKRRKNKKRK